VRDIIDYCCSRKRQPIIGHDGNSHHTLWLSAGTNPGGDGLLEFLVSSNLNILNSGNEPTFVVCSRNEVIDLTLGTNKMVNLVIGMYLEPSLSDHRYICFQIGNITVNQVTFRTPEEPIGSHIKTT
jgi:hypothetical protein